MNFLAHIYLSGNSENIMLGNFIADWVKGNTQKWQNKYNTEVIKGITIHRFIDNYTDTHEIVKKSCKRLQPYYGRYSGIFIDIFYDHFLAANWNLYSHENLDKYARNVYKLLIKNFHLLPKDVKHFLPFLIASNRLVSYSHVKGIQKAIQIMANHTSLPSDTQKAIEILEESYSDFNSEFGLFFKDLIAEVEVNFGINLSENKN